MATLLRVFVGIDISMLQQTSNIQLVLTHVDYRLDFDYFIDFFYFYVLP